MKKVLIIIFAILIMSSASYAAEVKNLQSTQVGNRVLFEFDVVGKEKETDVTVKLTVNGKEYREKGLHLEGDYGKVKIGNGRKVYWNVLQDFPKGYSGEFDFEITAGPNAIEGMVFVKGGCFRMGDTFGERDADEKPVHEVCLDDYYMDKYEVTQRAYRKLMGENPSRFKGDNNPVEKVSWHDAKNYCQKAGKRLPTEAEWEYAARSGGKQEKWAGTSNKSKLGKYAWYDKNSGGFFSKRSTHPVGQKEPNGLGIYDMSGNVWEWVSDWYDSDYYKNSPKWNPKGPDRGEARVLRGGSWDSNPWGVRAAYRYWSNPDSRDVSGGFRCTRTH